MHNPYHDETGLLVLFLCALKLFPLTISSLIKLNVLFTPNDSNLHLMTFLVKSTEQSSALCHRDVEDVRML